MAIDNAMLENHAIAVVDCNNFYAACERVVNPELQERPVVVLSHNDGMIISRSEEVKALGVPMAAPFFQYRSILEKHNTAVISANHATYYEFSHRVMDVLNQDIGASKVELYSIDEAFIDAGVPDKLNFLGRHIKNAVFEKTKIPVSVGVARTKTLAKLANNIAKKSIKANGVLDLYDSPFTDLALQKTAAGNVWGIGKRSAVKLKEQGIETAFQLKTADPERVRKHLKSVRGPNRSRAERSSLPRDGGDAPGQQIDRPHQNLRANGQRLLADPKRHLLLHDACAREDAMERPFHTQRHGLSTD
jgi:DNA polymerase V